MACVMEREEREKQEPVEEVELSREAILGAIDLVVEKVSVPEWGGCVHVRVMTGRERDAFETSMPSSEDKAVRYQDMRARLVALAICDASGQRLFDLSDIEALTKKSASALDRVFEVAARLNHLTERDQKELIENFAGSPSGVSGSSLR